MRGKRYTEIAKKVNKTKLYTKEDAIKLVKETGNVKFDESVEIAINLNLDPKKSEQQIRGSILLPHGSGKKQVIVVIAKGEAAKRAKEVGADFVGDIDLLEKIEKEKWVDYDVLVSTPEMMPLLGKLGKILGPKGLMPNPKVGTVTNDTDKIVKEIKQGRIEYKTDTYGNVHAILGKVSFEELQLIENIKTFVDIILKTKPSTVKGKYIKNISISSTMGPGIKIDPNSFDK